jgi:hypothetical protein
MLKSGISVPKKQEAESRYKKMAFNIINFTKSAKQKVWETALWLGISRFQGQL